jgi:signal transduction histidine kinase
VKTSFINEERHLIAVCTDITRLKQIETNEKKMKANFFSSVAHELRTPLNSIIPILKMIISSMLSSLDRPEFRKIEKLLKLSLNSAIHL